MKFKILEKVFDSTTSAGYGDTHFIYLNPTSQELHSKEDSKSNRGIIDDEGNLYMEAAWIQDKHKIYSRWIHDDLLSHLQQKNKLKGIEYDWHVNSKILNEAIFVHRYEDTLDFYLSETYDIDEQLYKEDIERVFALAKKKNPFLNFHVKNISLV